MVRFDLSRSPPEAATESWRRPVDPDLGCPPPPARPLPPRRDPVLGRPRGVRRSMNYPCYRINIEGFQQPLRRHAGSAPHAPLPRPRSPGFDGSHLPPRRLGRPRGPSGRCHVRARRQSGIPSRSNAPPGRARGARRRPRPALSAHGARHRHRPQRARPEGRMNLIEYVRAHLTEFVGILSTPDSDVGNILRAATAAIEELGLRPTVHRDVNAVTASSGSRGILLNGHLDTVPIASGWTREQGSWDGDFLYGRGTADMKAGCVAGLAAARSLLDAGLPVSLLFTTDEETTMKGAVKLAPTDLVKDAAAVVVGEPSRLRIITSEKGVLWYRASTSGRSAHGSLPHLGDNAIYRMMRFLAQLEPFGRPRDALSEITVSLGTIQGATKPKLLADLCTADLDCRHPPGTTKDHVEALLRKAATTAGEPVDLRLFHEVPPASVSATADHVRLLRDLAQTETVGVTYVTEMAYYATHNPRSVVFGPGETEGIHVR